jgi:hypothetical protein
MFGEARHVCKNAIAADVDAAVDLFLSAYRINR